MKRFILTSAILWAIACSGSSFRIPEAPQPSEPVPQPERQEGELRADGDSSATYALITACGYNYETPDTSNDHAAAPFQHIRQSWDGELKCHVFDFHIHIAVDDDRGKPGITDRQRNEIKTDGHSPASMVGQEGERMLFRWKFRLPEGMKTTQQFCHVHQIKGIDNAAGTADVSMPVITFTARTLSNGKRQLQVIYVPPTDEGGGNRYLARADLEEFLGEWVEAEERIVCSAEGSYEVRIRRLRDGRELLCVPATPLAMWRDGTAGMRPKWGIYRSFGKQGALKPQLRDEILRFADFEVKKEQE
ncbi:hypothetical protein [uncultured Alistipes sp.]|uniref:hypothetical protein n=1 Tax=uncultured Alistipes sp. TaxID=538949 RepID=UPI00266FCD46|nr:hypothetical protein [uncultured Alistipes sp.]